MNGGATLVYAAATAAVLVDGMNLLVGHGFLIGISRLPYPVS